MSYRDARRGAVIAGVLLVSMPLMDVLLGAPSPGLAHFAVGAVGVTLIVLSAIWRTRRGL